MSERIDFLATIPDLASAIIVAGGEDEVAQLKFGISDAVEFARVLHLVSWCGKLVRVTVEVAE